MRQYTPIDLPKLNRVEGGANGRRYVTPDGNSYPSVTTILSLHSDFDVEAWKKRVGEQEAARISKRATDRGTYIHERAEYLLKGIPHKVDRLKEMAYGETWAAFKPTVDSIGDVLALEAPLYSDYLQVAGTVDCVGYWNGKLSIIDFKTSGRLKSHEDIDSYWLQCSSYAVMWEERTKQPITQLVVLMSVDNESPLVYTDHRDNWIKKFIKLRKEYKQEIGD